MGLLVANCPRCPAANMTFDILANTDVGKQYSWENYYECFCVCRTCHRSTVFVLRTKTAASNISSEPIKLQSANDAYDVVRFISIKDVGARKPPEHIPPLIAKVFVEGSSSFTI